MCYLVWDGAHNRLHAANVLSVLLNKTFPSFFPFNTFYVTVIGRIMVKDYSEKKPAAATTWITLSD